MISDDRRVLGYTDDDELLAALQQVNGEELQASANLSQTASYDQLSTIGKSIYEACAES